MHRKQKYHSAATILCLFILIIDSKTAIWGGIKGIELCLQTVIPSLFPFFVLTNYITGNPALFSIPGFKTVERIIGAPQNSQGLILSAILGGYPSGAKCVAQYHKMGRLSDSAAQHLLPLCNLAGPAFIFGLCAGMFPHARYGLLLWLIYILSAFSTAYMIPFYSAEKMEPPDNSTSLKESVTISVSNMAMVCAWIIIFRILILFLQTWVLWIFPHELIVLFTGLLELSNGCCSLNLITDIKLRFVICEGLLCFGGLCVAMQTRSVCQKVSFKNYFPYKLLHCGIAILYSLIIMYKKWLLLIPILIIGIFPYNKRKKAIAFLPSFVYNAVSNTGGIKLCSFEKK